MSTAYYIRQKLRDKQEEINKYLEKEAEELHELVTVATQKIMEKDKFNKQFCNSASWYGGYPDEPEDYHLRKIWVEEIEPIRVDIGVYSGGKFNWHLMNVSCGYYELKPLGDEVWNYEELKVYEFPRNKEQFIAFMNIYKDKLEIINEYDEVLTLKEFLKEVDE